MKNVRSKLSLPGTKWVKVWTTTRTGGSGDVSVLLAVVSIIVMIGKDHASYQVAVSRTKLRAVTNKKKLGTLR